MHFILRSLPVQRPPSTSFCTYQTHLKEHRLVPVNDLLGHKIRPYRRPAVVREVPGGIPLHQARLSNLLRERRGSRAREKTSQAKAASEGKGVVRDSPPPG